MDVVLDLFSLYLANGNTDLDGAGGKTKNLGMLGAVMSVC